MPRPDLSLALLLAGLTAASRIPFRARFLPTWDAVQFALALREFDVVKHQPHPPGYILFVVAARALAWVLHDAAASLTWLAIGASALTVFLVYRLAFSLYGRPTALVAAVGLAASPLFWFYGVVGLSYTAEAALATLVVSLVWRMRAGGTRAAAGAALALGLAGGVRQSLLAVLAPLWLGMARAALGRWRAVIRPGLVLLLATVGWLGPMVWASGGVPRYLGATRELFESTVRGTSLVGPPGTWLGNLVALGEATILGLGLFLPALGWLLATAVGRVPSWGPRAWLFAGWVGPALVVYTGLHFGQYGYLLTVLPALYILIARGLVRGARAVATPRLGPRVRWAVVSVALAGPVLAHTAFFASAGPVEVSLPADDPAAVARWQSSWRTRYRFAMWTTTAGGLREQGQVIATYVEAIRREFDPATTVLVTELGNPRSYPWWRHVMYYLPEFPVVQLRVGRFAPGYVASQRAEILAALPGPEILLAPSARRLVWVVDYWNPLEPRPPGLAARPLAYGRWLYVLDLHRRPVEHAGYRLTPLTAVARLR